MSMEEALSEVNAMVKAGVIVKYAIGGAVAIIHYAEPVDTQDLDIVLLLPPSQGILLSVSPIYEFLKGRGHKELNEHMIIFGTPVQFLPAHDDLHEEALARAISIDFEGVPTFIVSAEHLFAIMVQLGRPKDRARIPLMLDSGKVDMQRATDILERHGLYVKWKKMERQIYGTDD